MTPIQITAEHLLRLLDEPPGVIHPDTLANAFSAYAWALTEDQTGMGRLEAHTLADWSPFEDRKREARYVKSIACAHSKRLRQTEREAIRAELERVIAMAEAA